MTSSIYHRALGADFNRLHPQIQRRFALSSAANIASVGRGVMDEIQKVDGRIVPSHILPHRQERRE
jgi:hypothetical protein